MRERERERESERERERVRERERKRSKIAFALGRTYEKLPSAVEKRCHGNTFAETPPMAKTRHAVRWVMRLSLALRAESDTISYDIRHLFSPKNKYKEYFLVLVHS